MYKLRPNPASVELWPADERLTDPQWAPGSGAGEAVARVTRSPFPSAPPLAMAPMALLGMLGSVVRPPLHAYVPQPSPRTRPTAGEIAGWQGPLVQPASPST